jgi:KDO2-lipid IV(A) lauroyltransferase
VLTRVSQRLAEALLWVLSVLPLPVLRQAGCFLGNGLALFASRLSRVTNTNLGLCFPALPPKERRSLARAALVQSATLACELPFVWSARWSEGWRASIKEIEGEEWVSRKAAERRGLLILVPHIGNWEMLSLYLADHSVVAPFTPPRSDLAKHLLHLLRTARGTRMVPIGTAGVRTLYRALAAGSTVALLPDQVPERSAGIHAPFFGQPALTMTLAARLARQTQAKVILGACLRCEGGFRLEFRPLVGFPSSEGEAESARLLNDSIEQMVKRFPDQYQWTYKRFKKPPEGLRDPYGG